MKKSYVSPIVETVAVELENAILSGSVTGSIEGDNNEMDDDYYVYR